MKLILGLMLFLGLSANAASTRLIGSDSVEGFIANQNLVKNSQCEPGMGSYFWSSSGTGVLGTTVTGTLIGRGSQSCSWDSGTASETLTGTLVSIPPGLYGQMGEISGYFLCNSGTCTHELHTWDGTSDVTRGTLLSGTTYKKSSFNFALPSSGSLAFRIKAVNADEPKLYFDELYLGAARITGPTIQRFLTGSGTYTTPPGAIYIRVKVAGGGGAGVGGGSGGNVGSDGSSGSQSSFGSFLLQANGGRAGSSGVGGAGGTNSVGSVTTVFENVPGGSGGGGIAGLATGHAPGGAMGGSNPLGGGGGGGNGSIDGYAGATNTGGGGGGGAGASASYNGAGGGAGGYIDALIASPSATYSYVVGAGGTGGVKNGTGTNGGAGAAGRIVVEEYYH